MSEEELHDGNYCFNYRILEKSKKIDVSFLLFSPSSERMIFELNGCISDLSRTSLLQVSDLPHLQMLPQFRKHLKSLQDFLFLSEKLEGCKQLWWFNSAHKPHSALCSLGYRIKKVKVRKRMS